MDNFSNIMDLIFFRGFPRGSMVKNLLVMQKLQEMQVQSLGQEDPLEKEMSTCSSILTWKILWTEEAGGPPSMVLQRARQD